MKTPRIVSLLLLLLVWASGCANYKKVQRVKNLKNCEYRIAKAKDFELVGVKLDKLRSFDSLNPLTYARILQALSAKGFPLKFNLVMEVKNPTSSNAELVNFDYDLYVDGVRWASGKSEHVFLIPGNDAVTQVPVPITVDMGRLFKRKSLTAIKKIILNTVALADQPTHFDVKIRPTLTLGKKSYAPKEPLWVSTAFNKKTGRQLRGALLN